MNWLRSLEHWDRGFESLSRHEYLGCVRLFCVYVALCVSRCLATGWSPSMESNQLCIRSRNWKSGQGPTKSCRAIIIIIIIFPCIYKERKINWYHAFLEFIFEIISSWLLFISNNYPSRFSLRYSLLLKRFFLTFSPWNSKIYAFIFVPYDIYKSILALHNKIRICNN
jgi:hypothetical protein